MPTGVAAAKAEPLWTQPQHRFPVAPMAAAARVSAKSERRPDPVSVGVLTEARAGASGNIALQMRDSRGLRNSRGVRPVQDSRGLIRTSKKNRLKRSDISAPPPSVSGGYGASSGSSPSPGDHQIQGASSGSSRSPAGIPQTQQLRHPPQTTSHQQQHQTQQRQKPAVKKEQPKATHEQKAPPQSTPDGSPTLPELKSKASSRPHETFEEVQSDMEKWHSPNKTFATCDRWRKGKCSLAMRLCCHFHGEVATGRRLGGIIQTYKRQFYDFLEMGPKDLIVVSPPANLDVLLFRCRSDYMKHRIVKVLGVLSSQTPGWERWISGEIGWDYGPFNKKDQIEQLKVAKEILSRSGILKNGPRERLRLTHSAYEDNITSVRKFMEFLMFKIKGIEKEKNGTINSSVDEIRRILMRLLRTSKNGPDVPCQWSAHAQENPYPLAYVTEKSQRELAKGIKQIAIIITENNLFIENKAVAATEDYSSGLPEFARLSLSAN